MDLEALALAIAEARLTGDDTGVKEVLRRSGWKPTHRAIPPTPVEIMARVKVDPETGCWVWQLNLIQGYGHYRGQPAHRASWEAFVGPLKAEEHLDHVCRNRACVRPEPEHLEPVSKAENNRRAIEHVQQSPDEVVHHGAKRWCKRGHAFDDSNTGVDRLGKRYCKKCRHEALKRWRAREKAKRAG